VFNSPVSYSVSQVASAANSCHCQCHWRWQTRANLSVKLQTGAGGGGPLAGLKPGPDQANTSASGMHSLSTVNACHCSAATTSSSDSDLWQVCFNSLTTYHGPAVTDSDTTFSQAVLAGHLPVCRLWREQGVRPKTIAVP
jgi:hypothetical protein